MDSETGPEGAKSRHVFQYQCFSHWYPYFHLGVIRDYPGGGSLRIHTVKVKDSCALISITLFTDCRTRVRFYMKTHKKILYAFCAQKIFCRSTHCKHSQLAMRRDYEGTEKTRYYDCGFKPSNTYDRSKSKQRWKYCKREICKVLVVLNS